MKKIILVILCVASVSCLTQKKIKTKCSKEIYQIGSTQIKKVDKNQLTIELQKRGKKMLYIGSPKDSLIYYTSSDYEILAGRKEINIVRSENLKRRYEKMKSLTKSSGSTVLSSDSISNFQNWVYAIEFTVVNSEKIGISIETDKSKILILTDNSHRATALGLMDAFTKELMNVKLNMK